MFPPPAQPEGGGKINSAAVVIVGGGATGVELAAELRHSARSLAHCGLDGLNPEMVRISVIESSPRLLQVLSAATEEQLGRLHTRYRPGPRRPTSRPATSTPTCPGYWQATGDSTFEVRIVRWSYAALYRQHQIAIHG